MTGLLRADLDANVRLSGGTPCPGARVRSALTVRFLAIALFRTAQYVGVRAPLLADLVKQLNHLLTGADLAWRARVGPGLVLFHPTGVVVGAHVRIGAQCRMQQGVTLGGDGGPGAGAGCSPTIGDHAVLGAGCRVLGSVRLGDDVRVGANAVVTHDVPDHATVVGVPARQVAR